MPTVLIVGAGPAGSVAAILLARRAWHVTLVEQHAFPRDKVCGECLSALGMDVLSRLSLRDPLIAAGAVPLRRCALHAHDGDRAELALPAPMWGLSRRRLDALLLDTAAAAGAIVQQPARCERIDARIVRIRDLRDNSVHHAQPDWVLLADGKGGLAGAPAARSGDLGLKAHFQDYAGRRDTIDLFGVHGHYGGVSPIEEDLWNTAFSIPESRFRHHRGNLDALFTQVLHENVALASGFARARRVGPWLASPLPRSPVARHWPRGVIPLGNAAAALEPIGGEGMGLALRSAELAAAALLQAHTHHDHPAVLVRLRRAYHRLWTARSIACRTAARLLSSPVLTSAGMTLVSEGNWLTDYLLAALGKSAPSTAPLDDPHLQP